MSINLVDWWLRIRQSYWFVPSLMVAGAVVSFAVASRIDARLGDSWLREFGWIYINEPAGARALLSTVAGSMITVAGVTFSMTLLAVSHATSQIGAHLMIAFMRDRGNQLTLGTFIATFVYCLLLLRSVQTGSDGEEVVVAAFIPHIGILLALLFTLLSVIVLIYFIHHVPQSINVSYVIARVGNDLERAVATLYPESIGVSPDERADTNTVDMPRDFAAASKRIDVDLAGSYLRVIDDDKLMAAAKEHDLVVELCRRPGDFAIRGQTLMRAWPGDRVDDEAADALRAAFSWGTERTANQDVMLPAEQLLEIMGKALSPGINNQFTAKLCIDQLARGIAAMLGRRVPAARRFDEAGNLRIVAEPLSQKQFLDAVFGPIRQYVDGDRIATRHAAGVLDDLARVPALAASQPVLVAESSRLLSRLETDADGPPR